MGFYSVLYSLCTEHYVTASLVCITYIQLEAASRFLAQWFRVTAAVNFTPHLRG